jgi:zinc transporter ZupT
VGSLPKSQQALLATALISIIPNIMLFCIPTKLLFLTNKSKNSFNFHNIFIAFAAGGLLGDVFIHIIPHLLGAHSHGNENVHYDHTHSSDHRELLEEHHSHEHIDDSTQTSHVHTSHNEHNHLHDDHDMEHIHGHDHGHGHDHIHGNDHGHGHDHIHGNDHGHGHDHHNHDNHSMMLLVGVCVLIGFIVFFAVERFASLNGVHHNHAHGDTNSHTNNNKDEDIHKDSTSYPKSNASGGIINRKTKTAVDKKPNNDNNDKKPHTMVSMWSRISISGYLNMIVDCLHNFTDGIALGAAFLATKGNKDV